LDHHYYHTGQFAQKASVSIRTLRYYDKVGLLSPSQYTEAGYRLCDVRRPSFRAKSCAASTKSRNCLAVKSRAVRSRRFRIGPSLLRCPWMRSRSRTFVSRAGVRKAFANSRRIRRAVPPWMYGSKPLTSLNVRCRRKERDSNRNHLCPVSESDTATARPSSKGMLNRGSPRRPVMRERS